MSKPIVIFTNFIDARDIIKTNNLLVDNDKKLYKVNLNIKNFEILSISFPNFNILKDSRVKQLNCLIPTTKMLLKLNSDDNWDNFINVYKDVLNNRRVKIIEWVRNLKDNMVYFCCNEEVTTDDMRSCRKCIYDFFINSKLKEKCILVYRNGKENINYNIMNNKKEASFRQEYGAEFVNTARSRSGWISGRVGSDSGFNDGNHDVNAVINFGIYRHDGQYMLRFNYNGENLLHAGDVVGYSLWDTNLHVGDNVGEGDINVGFVNSVLVVNFSDQRVTVRINNDEFLRALGYNV